MDWAAVIFGTIGGFVVSVLTVYLSFRKLPLELKERDVKVSADALKLAKEALADRLEFISQVEVLEKRVDELEKTIKGLQNVQEEDKKIIAQKDARINELEQLNLQYEQRIRGLETLIQAHEATIQQLQAELKKLKKVTGELRPQE